MSERQKKLSQLDTVFSQYIRLKAADANGYVHCFTCNTPLPWNTAECGHFVRRRKMPTRFDPLNCHPVCSWCNKYDEDHETKFAANLDQKYGEGTAERLEQYGRGLKQLKTVHIEEMLTDYRERVRDLKDEKGIQ